MNHQRAIWVYGDLRTGRFWQASLNVLTKARALARQTDAPVAMILMGANAQAPEAPQEIDLSACLDPETAASQAADSGADIVYRFDHPHLKVPRTDVYARVLADFVQEHRPWLVLVPLNDFCREMAAACAQHCQTGLIAECTELVLDGGRLVGRCPAWGGQVLADITLAEGWATALVTVHANEPQAPEQTGGAGEIIHVPLKAVAVPEGIELKQRVLEPRPARALEEAEIIVVGGAGLGDIRGFGLARELAATMGGEVAATRPPVLNHWVDENRLIGQTGKTVRPRLLISAGTSGAVQYTSGIAEAETIVAIDRDPQAPIFQWADIGLVADALAVLPLLTRHTERWAMRRLADAACGAGGESSAAAGGFGAHVRQLREARGWSTEDLAARTGQTPEFIDQVEESKLSPPVSFIVGMARAMQVDPGTFLRPEEQADIQDRRQQAYFRRTREYSYTNMTPDAENSHLRGFMVTIEAHQAHKPVAYKHEGEEFIFVLEGELEFTLSDKVHQLKPGEAIHFNSDVPHKLRNLTQQATRCLVVLYTP
jgi:electron transfer flavoprotein alpha subunit/quercetin dioxygenase-like cupin family protein